MAAETETITQSNHVFDVRIYGYLDAINAKLDKILTDQGRMETELRALMAAWSGGGLRGLRQAAGRFTNGH